jgi:UDP-GlcNAc:undecaprenyl-phosphate/decaprenyl-phosphate GlcNAc-1-phosphate transferase
MSRGLQLVRELMELVLSALYGGRPMSEWPPALVATIFFLFPLLVSWTLTALFVKLAPLVGLVDQPGPRKVHSTPTPRAGGVAIYVAAYAAALVAYPVDESFIQLLSLSFVIFLLGLIDDLRPLPWQIRLGVQALMAAVAVYSCLWPTGWVVVALALFWIVGLTNAFNMLDNMDALSGSVGWVAAACVGIPCFFWPQPPPLPQLGLGHLALMGAITGFLYFNRPRARIFMGDAGSTFLGFFLGVRSIELMRKPTNWVEWAPVVCIFAVPWYDLSLVVALRLWQSRSPFHADKQHVSHRLVDLGLSSPRAVAVIAVLGAASGLAGIALSRLTPGPMMYLLVTQVALWWFAIAAIEYFRFVKRSGNKIQN